MSDKILDKSRAFGVVVGARDGSAFWQDGESFRSDGSLVGSEPAPAETAAPVVPVVPAASEPAGVSAAELQDLHPSKIKVLVQAAGLPLETGKGSKARNIENLLAAG